MKFASVIQNETPLIIVPLITNLKLTESVGDFQLLKQNSHMMTQKML